MRKVRRTAAVLLITAVSMSLAACSSGAATATPSASTSLASTLTLGYFDNVTHAPALIGVRDGLLQKALGKTTLKTTTFSAGPAAVEALSAGAIDATYIGPSPAINSFLKSAGRSLTIVSGVASGGAALVVKPSITSAHDLKGTTIATPQLGNTQDVALRYWLKKQGLTTSVNGGGDVTVTPTDNAQALTLFQAGNIQGAWVPEPWVSRFVINGGAKVLVDEATQWPDGRFPTTVLAVSTTFLKAHPETVEALIRGNLAAIQALSNRSEAITAINAQLKADTGKTLAENVLERALDHVTFTADPDASTFPTLLSHASAVGLGTKGSLKGIVNLTRLNAILTSEGKKSLSSADLGAGS